MSKKRVEYIDIAKGIAMLAIIVSHMGFVDSEGNNVVMALASQFHVPVFLIASGFFTSSKRDIRTFAIDRAKKLLMPYLITCGAMGILILLLKVMTGKIQPPVAWPNVQSFVRGIIWGSGRPIASMPAYAGHIGAIWFLEALFFAQIIIRILLELDFSEIERGIFIVLLASSALWLAQRVTVMPFNVLQGLFASLYVYVGYVYKKYCGLELERTASKKLAIELMVITCLSCWLGFGVSVVTPSSVLGATGILVSLTTSYLVFYISSMLARRKSLFKEFFLFFGRNSLIILCVHLCCMNMGARWLVSSVLTYYFGTVSINIICITNLCIQLFICCLSVYIRNYVRRIICHKQ